MSGRFEAAVRALYDRRYGGDEWTKEILFGRKDFTYDDLVAGVADGMLVAFVLDRIHADVRAVLEAIREPDEAMVFNGAAVYDHPSVYMGGPSHVGKRLATRMFPKMIDSLLAEEKDKP